jgi:hypothetical protein
MAGAFVPSSFTPRGAVSESCGRLVAPLHMLKGKGPYTQAKLSALRSLQMSKRVKGEDTLASPDENDRSFF